MRTVVARVNQSMVDVAMEATGSIEAVMDFCRDNGVSITDDPAPGTVYAVTDETLAFSDLGVLRYLADEGVEFATMGAPASAALLNDDATPLLNDDGLQGLMADGI